MMLRMIIPIGVLVFGAAFAPAPTQPVPPAPVAERRCFPSEGARTISRAGTVPVYLRVRTGQTLEIAADPVCVDAGYRPGITVRPLGPEGANFCIGDSASLDVESPSVIARTCRANLVRVVPESEVTGLSNRVRP